jgi:hypothetical protein
MSGDGFMFRATERAKLHEDVRSASFGILANANPGRVSDARHALRNIDHFYAEALRALVALRDSAVAEREKEVA